MNASDVDTSNFDRVVFFTGAGMSAESGVPTYRGRGGVWTRYDFRTIACQEAFERDPEKVWDYHEWRRDMFSKCDPNDGHRIVAAVQQNRPGTSIVTQNIDGLHQRAGADRVIELHGSAWRVRCDAEGTLHEELRHPLPSRTCACGAWLRPDIVWFGDHLDRGVLAEAIQTCQACDLLVSVGTSAVVHPAAELPLVARQAGATCVEINPEDTPLSQYYDITLRTTASEGLRALWPDLAA